MNTADDGTGLTIGSEPSILPEEIAIRLKRNADGLIAAIVQDHHTDQVLMLAWMNDEALALTLHTGQGTYFSRSRKQLWVKGETSGNRQKVISVQLDCDGDAVLLRVIQTGPACHRDTTTCFDGGTL